MKITQDGREFAAKQNACGESFIVATSERYREHGNPYVPAG